LAESEQPGQGIIGLVHQIHPALQAFHPVDEAFDHFLAFKTAAVLGHDHFSVQGPDHGRPVTADFVGNDVAVMEALHLEQMGVEVRHRFQGFLLGHDGGAQIPGKENLGDRIVELEIALGMEKVGRQGLQLTVAQGNFRAPVRNADDPAANVPARGEVGDETNPQIGDHDLAMGGHEPLIHRSDNVRVRMGGQEQVQIPGGEIFLHAHEQPGIGHIAARVDQGAVAIVRNEELVGLDHIVLVVVDQVVEGKADVLAVVVKLNSHGNLSGERGNRGPIPVLSAYGPLFSPSRLELS